MRLPLSRELKRHADDSLAMSSYDPRRLVLLHTAAALGLNLLLSLLDYVLVNRIGDTGGLGGVGTRTMLSTLRSLLQVAAYAVLPFWQAGYTCAAIALAHRQNPTPDTLLDGFRKFGRILRLKLAEAGVYLLASMICMTVSTQIFMMTPLAKPYLLLMQDITLSLDGSATLTPELMTQMTEAIFPVMYIFGALFIVVAVFLFYQFRMAMYLLLHKDNVGAIAALKGSWRRMKGNRLDMLKLDLSFWWFYLLDIGCTAVLYLDLLLALTGVSLPVSTDAMFFLCLIGHCLCQLGLYTWMRNKVDVTYIHGYDAILGSSAYPTD